MPSEEFKFSYFYCFYLSRLFDFFFLLIAQNEIAAECSKIDIRKYSKDERWPTYSQRQRRVFFTGGMRKFIHLVQL